MSKLKTNTKSTKSLKLQIRLKAWKEGKLIVDTTRRKKRPLQHFTTSLKGVDRYYLKVTYGMGQTSFGIEEIYNDGDYFNKKDLLQALSIFTSKDEVDDYLDNFAISRHEKA